MGVLLDKVAQKFFYRGDPPLTAPIEECYLRFFVAKGRASLVDDPRAAYARHY
jgi:hypothetical protein